MSSPNIKSIEEFSNTPSEAETTSEIPDSDAEKFPALFGVPQMLKSAPEEARLQLVEAVGYFFLARMLRSKEAPPGCPPRFYQSVALSVLACFVDDEDIMTDAGVLFNIPEILNIIENSDSEEYEDDFLMISDAYKVITGIVATEAGREAFIASRGINVLCSLNVRQSFQDEDALELLLDMLTYEGQKCWLYHSGSQDLNRLLLKISTDFTTLENNADIDLSDIICNIIKSFPKSQFDKSLLDKKTVSEDNEPKMQLVASVIELSDVLVEDAGQEKLFLPIFYFDSLEVIVNLAKHRLEEVLDSSQLMDSVAQSSPAFYYKEWHLYNCRTGIR